MKFALQILLTILLGFFAQQFFPFWVIAVVAAAVGLLFKYNNSLTTFSSGFLAGMLLWAGYAWWLSAANTQMLSVKLGELFKISPGYLVYFTGLLGALLAGFGAMTGTLARKIFEQKPA